MPETYITKPKTVEAIQFDGTPMRAIEIEEWTGGVFVFYKDAFSSWLEDRGNNVYCHEGDWVVKTGGAFFLSRKDDFENNYTKKQSKEKQ